MLLLFMCLILSAVSARAVEIVSSNPNEETIPWTIETVLVKKDVWHVYGTQRLTYNSEKKFSFD